MSEEDRMYILTQMRCLRVLKKQLEEEVGRIIDMEREVIPSWNLMNYAQRFQEIYDIPGNKGLQPEEFLRKIAPDRKRGAHLSPLEE